MATNGANDHLAGRVLAGRYRLLAPIGTGASGRVYAADDIRLNRRVAVKVLHAALAEDAGFLRRFRAEAQVAASLHHPHIMAVYDWGEDEQPFMVVELLEGGSLRTMLDRGNLLSIAQGARIGRDVAAALDYAHSRGIVHRDVKPANLLFDEHGNVRIADFGLARALAEASWTEPAGAVFGTARYASPEQARGVQLDARSDLYSLALVLVEAVTGSIPFASDTTIGTLAARTQRPIVAPPELGPLQAPIERSGQIDPAARYPNAATMEAALADVVEALPKAEPLVLPGIADASDPHPTQAVNDGTSALFDQDASAAAAIALDFPPIGATRTIRGRLGLPPRTTQQRARQRRVVPLVVLAAIAAATALGTSALAQVGNAGRAAPSLVGLSLPAAKVEAKHAGLAVHVSYRSASDPKDVILDQSPPPGDWLYSDRTVALAVSSGPPDVAVPNLRGMVPPNAERTLRNLGLVPKLLHAFQQNEPKGRIFAERPDFGESIAPGKTVEIYLSDGPAPQKVPDVHGLKCDAATAQLLARHLNGTCKNVYNDTAAVGDVVGTTPPVGTLLNQGTAVTINVSKGPPPVLLPDVRRHTVAYAVILLQSLGFRVYVSQPQYNPKSHVFGESPKPGTLYPKGTPVTLIL
jgi:serine/threonine-protein kinase